MESGHAKELLVDIKKLLMSIEQMMQQDRMDISIDLLDGSASYTFKGEDNELV